jgi:threonine/homoserine/homoserine lactone efflux protein
MDLLPLVTFAGVYSLAVASPGPAVAALLGRAMAGGGRGLAGFCGGLILGDLLWLVASALGISALAAAYQPLFLLLKWAGILFLLWMAWKLWTAPAVPIVAGDARGGTAGSGAVAGLTLALGNPKTMLFFVAVLPTVMPLDRLSGGMIALLALVAAVVMAVILGAYAWMALRLRERLQSARAVRAVNRTSGGMLAGAALVIATRS